MASFGTYTLLLAMLLATWSGAASVVGVRRQNWRLVRSGRLGAYAVAAVLGLASLALVYAFVVHDYSLRYVQHYSDATSPLFYRITSYWGGLDGSMLWWASLLAALSAAAIYTNRNRHRDLLPYVVATLMVITDFFLCIIIFDKNPFEPFVMDVPSSGQGLNPLLQNAYMATHPPALYAGFVGMSIPYAFGMAALVSGQLDDTWIESVRRWTLAAWLFLSLGLVLGMIWAYEELGWGGFWAWDAVENAGLLPWLTATAFLHSIMIQERRGMLKIWNMVLVVLTFFLTVFGTFMTRTGIVQSVHAFGQDTTLAWIFAAFMAFMLVVSVGFILKRMPELRARASFDSWLSREAAFTVNNWLFVMAAFVVLFGTLFPTIAQALTGERVNIGPADFNRWMIPIGLGILFLTGVGPMIAWRKASPSSLRYQFTIPITAAVATTVLCVVLGLRAGDWAALLAFALSAFVAVTVFQEIARGLRVRRQNTGSDVLTSLVGMVLRGRRRYGGYVVHLGVALLFVGFAGTAFQHSKEVRIEQGKEAQLGKYTVRLDRVAHEEDRQKEMVTGVLDLSIRGKPAGSLRPAKWFFRNHEDQPTTEVAIHRAASEDFYVTMGNYDVTSGVANLKLTITPLVDWVWIGFLILALGCCIALIPDSMARVLSVQGAVEAAAETGGAET